MATHDYVIDNSTGANVRSDINNVLQAILTNNSSSSAPSTTAAYMWWADTTTGILKIRNSANDGWVELFQLDGTLTLEDGSAAAPALSFRDDLDTGIYSAGANNLNFATNGVSRLDLSNSNTVFNEGGNDIDFRIEGDTDANLLYINAGEDRVCIGNNTVPSGFKFSVNGDITIGEASGTDNSFIDQKQNGALELINSGIGSNNAGMIRINRYNTVAGGTTAFRDTIIYDGKNSQLLFVDGSAGRIGIGSAATSPGFMLDVQHATDNCVRLGNTNNTSQGSHFAALVFGATYYNKAYIAAHSLEFYVNGSSIAKRFEMQADGDFVLNDGNVHVASGHGIDFSLTADSAATGATDSSELFNDYEEGTWTPLYQNVTAPTFDVQTGRYTKVGRFVYCTGRLSVQGGTALDTSDGSGVNIGGLPFSGNSDHHACLLTLGRFLSIFQDGGANVNTVRFGGNFILLMTSNGNEVTYTECNAFGDLTFAFSYQL